MSERIPDVGHLRHRIVFEVLTRATDSQGGETTTWATYATVYGLLEPSAAREVRFSEALQYRRTHKCFVRYRSDVTYTTAMRILFDSRYFQIKSIFKPDERKFFLRLDLEENVAA
jgi:SPP1 family predicted phage head-tail adaptor